MGVNRKPSCRIAPAWVTTLLLPLALWTPADGGPLGDNGFVRVVMPGDLRGGRFVSNIASLQLLSIPMPSTLLLVGTAVMACGLLVAVARKSPGKR